MMLGFPFCICLHEAYDKTHFKRLLKKLHNYGVSGNILLPIRNWLKNRKQIAGINHQFSGIQLMHP